jgi:hypothetical protein
MSRSRKTGTLRLRGGARPLDQATEPRSYDRRFYAGVLLAAALLIVAVVGFAVYRTAFYKEAPPSGPTFDLSSLAVGSGGLPDPQNPCVVLQEYLESTRRKHYEKAYGFLCQGLKRESSMDDFVSNAQRNALLFNDISAYLFRAYKTDGGAASASGYVVYKSGGRSRVEATFAREGSSWKIALLTVVYQ